MGVSFGRFEFFEKLSSGGVGPGCVVAKVR